MGLADAVQNSYHRAQVITWTDQDGNPIDLTNATLYGIISRAGVESYVTGTLTVTNPTGGVFSWAYSGADVAQAGVWFVQFYAHYQTGGKPEISLRFKWFVSPAFGFVLASPSLSPSASLSPSSSASA